MPSTLNGFNALNNSALRTVNETLILNLIRERQPISRADLARLTELRESTVSSIIKGLLDQNLVIEASLGESSGGRKPRMLRLDGKRARVLAIDVAAEQTTLGIADLTGAILHRKSIRTHRDSERFLKQVLKETEAIIDAQIRGDLTLDAIGVNLLGLVDYKEGAIIYSANLGWHSVPIGKILRQNLPYKIVIEGNVRAAGQAELWFGQLDLRHISTVAVVVVDEGISAAVVENGVTLRGSTGGAGEFGHISIDPQGVRCSCGAPGCWEAYAAEPAMLKRYIARLPKRNGAEEGLNAPEVVRRALAGDADALAAVRETARCVGFGFAILVNAVNPGLIVLEGALAEAWRIVEPEIWEGIRQRALAPNYASLRLQPSQIHKDFGLVRAVSLALAERFAIAR